MRVVDATERLRVGVVVGVADVDVVPLGQDRAEPDSADPRMGAEQVVEDLLPEPFAPLHRARQLLVVRAPRAGQVGGDLLQGHVAALPLDPQVERPDDGEHQQQAGSDRQDQPAPSAGGQEDEGDGGRAGRCQEAPAGLRGRHQEREYTQDRQPCVATPRSVPIDQPIDPEPQERTPTPRWTAMSLKRKELIGVPVPGTLIPARESTWVRPGQRRHRTSRAGPAGTAEQAGDEGRLAQRGGATRKAKMA